MVIRNASFNRRALLASLACAPAAWAGLPNTQLGKAYTAKTAPDSAGRKVLSLRIPRLDQGAAKGMSPAPAIHKNFPQVIEQNLARMDPLRTNRWLATMSATELTHLAQAYGSAVNDSGHKARIYELLATRLSGEKLGMLSQYFGFGPLYAGVLNAAPEKSLAFQQFALQPTGSPVRGATPIAIAMGPSASIEMTILEVYLEFRTAPIGSLGVNAALYETAVFSSKHLIAAYGAGYLLGTGLAWGIQFFAPTLWDSIGQGIYKVVNWIISATTNDALGYAMEQSASLFDLDTASYDALSLTGGDYGVTYEWASMNGGGDCSRHYWAICDNW